LLATLNDIPVSAARPRVESLLDEGNLRLRPLSDQEYEELAKVIMEENPEMVAAIREKGQKGKVMWFVGQMVRRGEEGTVEPEQARAVVERLFEV
jgi:aspartyl-tRNA(Asn)/glutamyl-tRNA(Gln) amidotransferase subunit B